jgi:DNA-binding CsgD family transcriptional regulator
MDDRGLLRPIERRMLKLAEAGVPDVEIAWQFRRTPKNVRQVIALARLPRQQPPLLPPAGLRPIERRVLRWRDEGADFAELASRFRRRPSFLAQVEQLARYKLAR